VVDPRRLDVVGAQQRRVEGVVHRGDLLAVGIPEHVGLAAKQLPGRVRLHRYEQVVERLVKRHQSPLPDLAARASSARRALLLAGLRETLVEFGPPPTTI
jgi:hypothetical protein